MRLPWPESKPTQLDLLGDEPERSPPESPRNGRRTAALSTGRPCLVPVAQIDEDPANPRAEFSNAALDELAADIRRRGILVPLVVHPADANGRHLLHFGAMRLRASILVAMGAGSVKTTW